ncbi:hypothetical protein ACFYNO_09590 [Kitasatospora sp. NPDC006697]|uniref:hypothetical protein n=1 Tax=Kitasatospora sp. NPDC006697 TaxID=3364020 RepID=UPI00369D70C3
MTNDAPDTAEERWQRIRQQLDRVRRRVRSETDPAIAALDDCLRRLDALRDGLARAPAAPGPGDQLRVRAQPVASQPAGALVHQGSGRSGVTDAPGVPVPAGAAGPAE